MISILEPSDAHLNQESPLNCQLIASLLRFSKAASVAVFLIGCAVIIGWEFEIALLKSLLPGLVTMKGNTALCFILGSSALWLLHQAQVYKLNRFASRGTAAIGPSCRTNFKDKTNKYLFAFYFNSRPVALVLAITVIIIALITLIQYAFDLDLGIDQLLFEDDVNPVATYAPGRMAVNTAINFILLGSAIILLMMQIYSLAQAFCMIVSLVSFLGLLGYLYNINYFYGFGNYTAMALHTSVSFILLAIGSLFAYPNKGLMKIATSNLAGGIMLRRLFLPVIGIPPILCWLILLGKRLEMYDSEVGIALLCVLNIFVLLILIWWNAKTLGAVDYQGLHDMLTSLPNRIFFNKQLSVSIAKARYQQEGLAVMFLDLDRFKKINDNLGHAVGDRLLKAVVKRLTDCLRESDTLARWGGDEFTLFLKNINGTHYTAETAQKIINAFKSPFLIGNHYLYITISIGIALYPYDGEDPETLIKNADVALYSAKAKGRNNYQFYTAKINEQSSELLFLENRLHHAWEREEFQIYYQPKVNINTGKVTGMEALLRWYSPELGFISPVTFIPIAEENGLIVQIGEWVLQTACAQNKAWLEAGLSPIRIAVNLSPRQFQEPNLLEMVAQILAETGLDPWLLELEITETTAMQNADFTKEILLELNRMGVLISIDDFGTGYSSLNYLKKFPVHTIKIDRSFVRDLTIDPYDMAIASAVVALGHGLNMNVVAEGVETKEQLECLREIGCEEMQGYFFSKPLPDQEAIALLKNYRARSVKTN